MEHKTKEEKIQFILTTLEKECKRYINTPNDFYTHEELYWIDQYLTKLYFKGSLQNDKNLEIVYPAIVKMDNRLNKQ